jgi:NADH-quinone oxidoreductase subunit H
MLLLTAEFIHMVTAALLIVILYLGGWHLWGLTSGNPAESWPAALARVGTLWGKTLVVILFFMLVRWTWPRFRYDQLMALAWKGMLPLGMIHLVVVALLTEYGRGLPTVVWVAAGWSVALSAWALAAWSNQLRN